MIANIRHASNHAPERHMPGRGFSLWLIPLFLLVFISGNAFAQFAGGTGTAQNPYQISTVVHLQNMRGAPNGAHYSLTNNIDASVTSGWNGGQGFDPIGWFGGVLDGNGFTISNLVINRGGMYNAALFTSSGSNAQFKNLTLQNITVVGGGRAATLVGTLGGTVINVRVTGSVSGTGINGGLAGQIDSGGSISDSQANVTVTGSGERTGGLVGDNNGGAISNSSSSGTINGTSRVGGLTGHNAGTISNAQSSATVTGSGSNVGGLIGWNHNGIINQCTSSGNVSGSSRVGGLVGFSGWSGAQITHSSSSSSVSGGSRVGGLVGFNQDGLIEACFSNGSASGTEEVGGLVGFLAYSGGVISMCYSTATVNNSGQYTGGLVGRLNQGRIENSFALGAVTGKNRTGGLVGQTIDATLINCFAAGPVSGNGHWGGLVGESKSTDEEGCFYDEDTTGTDDSAEGDNLETFEMKTLETYTDEDWDFTNIWGMQPPHNDGYPFLLVFPPVIQDFTWTGSINTAWHNSGNWNTNTVPDTNDNIIIPNVTNKPVISTSVEITGITIDSGSSLTIDAIGSLTVTGQLINNAGASGLIIRSTANGTGSFIYNGAVTGSFQRYIGNSETWQLLSSPVASQEISGDFTPSGTYGDLTGYDFYTWHEPDTAWVYLLNTSQAPTWSTANGGSNQFIPGRGYLVSYQDIDTKTFSGNFNHSQVSIPITKSGDYAFDLENEGYSMFSMNLAGNPYPSSIDWKAQSGWGRNDLEQTGGGYDIWIWSESNSNYGVYNSGSSGDIGTLSTSRYLAPNQGFFVRATGNGTLTINTGVKSHQGSGNWINKSGTDLSEQAPGKLHLRIEDRNGNGADEVIVEFGHTTTTKTPGSPKLFSMIETAPSLYIPKDKKSYSIRRMKTPDQNPLLPLSFIAGSDGEYVIKAAFDHTDSNLDMVVLEDLQTDQTHDFKTQGDYVFFATVKDKAERFQIRFKEGNYANPHARLPVSAYTHNKTLAIDLRLVDPGETCLVEVFDSLGRKVFEGSYNGNSLYEVTLDGLQGAFMVQISTRQASYGGKVMFF